MVTEQQLAMYLAGDLRDAELTTFEDEMLMDASQCDHQSDYLQAY